MNFRENIKKILPKSFVGILRKIRNRFNVIFVYKKQQLRHINNLAITRKKYQRQEKIVVAFFALHKAVWKLEGVYKEFDKDPRFKPIIVVCPIVNYGRENMLNEMDEAYKYFLEKGYQTLRTYNVMADKYLDVRKEMNPDIIFYTNPYKGLIHDNYYIDKFKDKLTLYVNYTFFVTNLAESFYNSYFSHSLWKYFHETSYHQEMAQKYSNKKLLNGVVTGYPGVDNIEFNECKSNLSWKKTGRHLKKIIWAPHHTIENNPSLDFSNFLDLADKMLNLSIKFKDSIQLAFKPHPLLRVKLYNEPLWGKVRTDSYYKKWEENFNTQINSGEYIDLFNSSDALIHDSASFAAEYLYTGKPVLFCIKENSIIGFNDFGIQVLEQHYHARNIEEIIEFITTVVINSNDFKEKDRNNFLYKHLHKNNDFNASEKIFNHIKSTLI